MKIIVVSAVNIVEAGPLVILKDCLSYLSALAQKGEYKVVAVVYKKELAHYPNIEYIETQWPKKRWLIRLWYEYVRMKKISKAIGPVYLWLSLHDTSPNVKAERQAVYCHNAFSFYDWKWREIWFAPKIVLFSIFTKYIYALNIAKNKYLVVQQNWFREAMEKDFNFDKNKIIVAKPSDKKLLQDKKLKKKTHNLDAYSFLFPASPNSHKNFECLCEAVAILEKDADLPKFKVYITMKGNENAYAKWLLTKWGKNHNSISFIGFLTKEELVTYYEKTNCLVFPSKSESWGLPISEFAQYEKPMLLADKPYARETAAGSKYTAFFDPDSPERLAQQMEKLINNESDFLKPVDFVKIEQPVVEDWSALFTVLLKDDHENITGR